MSIAIAQRIVAGLRAAGVTVHESSGCYARGNGQTSDYQGLVVHHTASNFGRDYKTLYDGRSDLSGPLCNSSGNDDGSITIIAAHPANHAGASGGWDTAPLPRTSSFNRLVWGHEVVYPGVEPMRPAQYQSALALARVVCDVLGKPLTHVKFHQGTSVTGKWDPGYANGKTYDVAQFRRDAAASTLTLGGFLMALTDNEQREILESARANRPGLEGSNPAGVNVTRQISIEGKLDAVLASIGGRDDVDENALAEALAPLVIPSLVASIGAETSMTSEEIQAATERAVRAVFADAGA